MVVVGINDLVTTNPKLIEEWNYDKNSIHPTEITAGSGKRVWWLCSVCGHEWEAIIEGRNQGRGCPQCTIGKRKNNKRMS